MGKGEEKNALKSLSSHLFLCGAKEALACLSSPRRLSKDRKGTCHSGFRVCSFISCPSGHLSHLAVLSFGPGAESPEKVVALAGPVSCVLLSW